MIAAQWVICSILYACVVVCIHIVPCIDDTSEILVGEVRYARTVDSYMYDVWIYSVMHSFHTFIHVFIHGIIDA